MDRKSVFQPAALFLALPLGLVYGIVYLVFAESPLGTRDVGIHILVFIGCLAVPYGMYAYVFSRKKLGVFIAAALSVSAVLILISIAAGMQYHRDFYTATFQYIMAAPVAFIFYCISPFRSEPVPRTVLRVMSTAGFILSIFYAQWIILMGFAISTRMEPRPLQSLAYNAYNLVLVFLLFFLSRAIGKESFRTLTVSPDSLNVDGQDLSALLGEKKTALVTAFASAPDRSFRCDELQRILEPALNEDNTHRCESCVPDSAKATLCSRYRTTYNIILDIKKVLEFAEIGTITAPENRRKILEEGWKLKLFANARIRYRRDPSR